MNLQNQLPSLQMKRSTNTSTALLSPIQSQSQSQSQHQLLFPCVFVAPNSYPDLNLKKSSENNSIHIQIGSLQMARAAGEVERLVGVWWMAKGFGAAFFVSSSIHSCSHHITVPQRGSQKERQSRRNKKKDFSSTAANTRNTLCASRAKFNSCIWRLTTWTWISCSGERNGSPLIIQLFGLLNEWRTKQHLLSLCCYCSFGLKHLQISWTTQTLDGSARAMLSGLKDIYMYRFKLNSSALAEVEKSCPEAGLPTPRLNG